MRPRGLVSSSPSSESSSIWARSIAFSRLRLDARWRKRANWRANAFAISRRLLGILVAHLDRDDVRVVLDIGVDAVEKLLGVEVDLARQRALDALGDRLVLDQREVRARHAVRVAVGARAREKPVDRVGLAHEHLRHRLVLVVLGRAVEGGDRDDDRGRREDQPAALAERVQEHPQPLTAVGGLAL